MDNVKAVYSFGLYGIEILNDINDKIVWRYSNETKQHISKIYYYDRLYFKANNKRIYLDECMRV